MIDKSAREESAVKANPARAARDTGIDRIAEAHGTPATRRRIRLD